MRTGKKVAAAMMALATAWLLWPQAEAPYVGMRIAKANACSDACYERYEQCRQRCIDKYPQHPQKGDCIDECQKDRNDCDRRC